MDPQASAPSDVSEQRSAEGNSSVEPVRVGLSFKQGKGRPKVGLVNLPGEVKKDFVSVMKENGFGEKEKADVKVIPKLENKWRPESKMRSLQETMREHSLIQTTEDRFEVEETIAAGKMEGVQYGLQIKVKKEVVLVEPEYRSVQEQESAQLKKDLTELPDEADGEAYESMPIEDFGKAMLRGMGWVEGKAVGRNSGGKVVEPVVNVPRPDRLGLGAEPKPLEVKEKKYIKPGETRGPKPDLVAAPGSDGRPRNSRKVDEELVEREKKGVHVGKIMEIVEGRHSRLKGEVLSIRKGDAGRSDRAKVRLRGSEEIVEVRVQELADFQTANGQSQKANGSGYANGAAEDGRRKAMEREDSRQHNGERRVRQKVEESRQEQEDGQAPWLVPHIRVRIVSKSLQSGRLYLKKAVVQDVVTPSTADLTVDETGQSLQGVHQSSLETALPKRGGNVAVVSGEHRGRKGRLIERDSDRGVGVVQFSDHKVEGVEIVRLELDSVAEFVGHDDDLD